MNRGFLGGHLSVDQMFPFEQSKQSNHSELFHVNRKEPSGSNSVGGLAGTAVTADSSHFSGDTLSYFAGQTHLLVRLGVRFLRAFLLVRDCPDQTKLLQHGGLRFGAGILAVTEQ